MEIKIILFVLEVALWVLWLFLSMSKKSSTISVFLVCTGIIWAGLTFFSVTYHSDLFFVLILVPVIFLSSMVRIISEYERGVIFRFGRLIKTLEPGLNLIFPLGIDWVQKIDLRTFTIDVPKQEIITKDNVPVHVDAVVYFNVFDPVLSVTKVATYVKSTSLLGQTTLRSVIGQHELDEILSQRTKLNEVLQQLLDKDTDPWGIKVTSVEIKAIELPESMKRAMAKQAEAERERRAKIISAEGEYQASEKLASAAKIIGSESVGIQLRYLQTLSEIAVEKNSTVIFPIPIEILRYFESKQK